MGQLLKLFNNWYGVGTDRHIRMAAGWYHTKVFCLIPDLDIGLMDIFSKQKGNIACLEHIVLEKR